MYVFIIMITLSKFGSQIRLEGRRKKQGGGGVQGVRGGLGKFLGLKGKVQKFESLSPTSYALSRGNCNVKLSTVSDKPVKNIF